MAFSSCNLLHLLDHVLKNDSLVNHSLEILIIYVEKLELDLVVESIRNASYFFSSVLISSGAYLDN
jgi:hypothetical protein